MSWFFGGPTERLKPNLRDRPPLSAFFDKYQTSTAQSFEPGSSVSNEFLQVPLESIGRRVDHNAESASSVIHYCDERSKELGKLLKDMRRNTPAIVTDHSHFSGGSLEKALQSINKLHEQEVLQVHSRVSSLDLIKQQLSTVRDNLTFCAGEYEAELHRVEQEVSRAREKLFRTKGLLDRSKEKLLAVRHRIAEGPVSPPPQTNTLLSAVKARSARLGSQTEAEMKQEEEDLVKYVEAAEQQLSVDADTLLSFIKRKDEVVCAVALAFDWCDKTMREAVKQTVQDAVQIEINELSRRLKDLQQTKELVDSVCQTSDRDSFISSFRNPESTRLHGAALGLLHTHTKLSQSHTPPPPPTHPHDSDDEDAPSAHELANTDLERTPRVSCAALQDRLRSDMDRIVIALFTHRATADSSPTPSPAQPEDYSDPLRASLTSAPTPHSPPVIPASDHRLLLKHIHHEQGREAFVYTLNQQRSRRTEITDGFDVLAEAFSEVLSICQSNDDTKTAKMAMMLSQTFYRETPANGDEATGRCRREYIKSALVNHPIWQNITFWEDACWISIREALGEGDSQVCWYTLSPEGLRDVVATVHNTVFSQIGAYAHSMVEFGCSRALARQFVTRLATTYQLSSDQREMLLELPQLVDEEAGTPQEAPETQSASA